MDVAEYSAGDYTDGHVFDPVLGTSYPKFLSSSGRYKLSLMHGVWDSLASAYDPDKLCVIDFPVLKAHMWGGSSVAIKNWVGVMTTAYADERYGGFFPMHSDWIFGPPAIPARLMTEGIFPDLTIVDATWTSGRDYADLRNLVNTKTVLASTDPAAVSWYAAKFILTPIATGDQTALMLSGRF